MTGFRRTRAIGIAGAILLNLLVPTARADARADLDAARALQDAERWAESDSLASTALARLEREPAPDSLAIADALGLVGVARWRTVGYADGSGLAAAARSLRIRERHLPPDDLDLADAHVLVARFLPEVGRPDSAQFHVRRALAIREARLAPADTTIARTWDQLALIQRNSGDMKGALDSWTRAIAIRKSAHGPEHPEVARLLAQTGVPWMEFGDLDHARAVLEESLRMFARTSGPDDWRRWTPLNILGDVEKRSGNVARNVDLVQEALRVAVPHFGESSREALTLRANLAVALYEIGDESGSIAIWNEILPLVRAQYGPSHPRTLQFRQAMALVSRVALDYETAIQHFSHVDSVLSSQPGPPPSNLPIIQGQIAEVLFWQGRYAESRVAGERALRTAEAVHVRSGERIAGIQSVHVRTLAALGDTAATDRALHAMFEIDRELALGTRRVGSDVRLGAARASRLLGRDEDAWRYALEAETISRDVVRTSLHTLPDRRALLLARIEGRFLDFVLDLARRGPPDRRAVAWDRLVRTRGAVRAEIARRRIPLGLAADTTVVGLHDRWLAAQRHWARRLVSAGGAVRDSAARAGFERLRLAVDESEASYARALSAHGAGTPVLDVGLAEVRSRLAPGQALVGCIQVGPLGLGLPHELVAFVARAGEEDVACVGLGPSADVRAVLDAWRDRLATSPGSRARAGDAAERACRSLGAQVRTATWDRIATHLRGVHDVFLVADGPLLDVPWHALPDGDRGYLVESGPRLHLLNAERDLVDRETLPESGKLLALGAPDYENGARPASFDAASLAVLVRAAPDPCASGALPTFTPLPGSGAEAEAVARSWRSDPAHAAVVLTGADASEAALKREAHGKTILHLATHGVVTSDRCAAPVAGARGVGRLEPLATPASNPPRAKSAQSGPPSPPERAPSPWLARRVWLALAGANRAGEHEGDENEGILTAEEVLTLDLAGTDWVVLSACHSGLADTWSRDGALGMRRAFDLAGARSVIASSWAVEDAATREWMEALYAARAGGATAASAAVEAANRRVLAERRRERRSTHPFYWAAFAVSGE